MAQFKSAVFRMDAGCWVGAVYKDAVTVVWSTTRDTWREAMIAADDMRKRLENDR